MKKEYAISVQNPGGPIFPPPDTLVKGVSRIVSKTSTLWVGVKSQGGDSE